MPTTLLIEQEIDRKERCLNLKWILNSKHPLAPKKHKTHKKHKKHKKTQTEN